ncbi:MAG: hypothetical protein NC301_01360 [Bacteroides sp.]|nr:hypothetical protein [Bacteroides sp.]MCM1378740.1 hypothetical protein [Bacteroides sp.]MCM1445357.1 hypothetical protein [Prevotella sp.]
MIKYPPITFDTEQITRLDMKLYCLYLFMMPLGRLIPRPDGLPTTLKTIQFSTIIMLIGVVLLLRKRKFSMPQRMYPLLLLYAFMVIYSLIAALVISTQIPIFHGKLTLMAPMENIVNYFITFLSLYYNYICLSSVKDFKSLGRVFDAVIYVLLFVGYIQFGMINGIPGCRQIYSLLGTFLLLYNPDTMINSERGVTLFGAEPSSMSNMFFVIIPYLCTAVLYKWPKRRTHIVMLALFFVIFWTSDSSSVTIMLILAIICYILCAAKPSLLKIASVAAFCGGLFIAILYSTAEFSSQSMDTKSLEYRMYGKVVDKNNYSTMMRSSTIAVDMKIFAEHPLTGVGLGMQGLWYEELTPRWTRASMEVQSLFKRNAPIANGGGCFFPVWVSAFGFIGVVVLIIFLAKYLPYVKKLNKDRALYSFYMIGMIGIILSMWYVISPKLNENICFMLVFPLAYHSHKVLRS